MVDDVRRPEGLGKPGLIARKVVGRENNALFTVLFGDFLEFCSDFVQGLIPGNFLEFAGTALALALQGLLDAKRMVPEPERLRAAAAIAALRMRGVREDAHRVGAELGALLLHGEHAATGAAHAAGRRMGFPTFFLELLNGLFNLSERDAGETADADARRGRTQEGTAGDADARSRVRFLVHELSPSKSEITHFSCNFTPRDYHEES